MAEKAKGCVPLNFSAFMDLIDSRQLSQSLHCMRAEHCDPVAVLRSLHVFLSPVLELSPPSPDQSEISFLLPMLNNHLWMDINDTP